MAEENNYDQFAAVRQEELRNGTKFSHTYVEKPMMANLLPNLSHKKVLMLGCGTGEESVLLKKHEAKELVGMDQSPESIRLANETYPEHTFVLGDMHVLNFPDNSFDFVYSSLAIHYSEQPQKVYQEVYRILKSGGQFLFSVGHPVRWASEQQEIGGATSRIIGFSENKKNPRLYGGYLTFKKYNHHFLGDETLSFWVAPPSLHFKLLKEAGFAINDFVESRVIDACERVDDYYYKRYSEFPQFVAFLVTKN